MAEVKHPVRNGIIIGVSVMAIGYGATLIPGFWHWVAGTIASFWVYTWGTVTVGRWLLFLLSVGCVPVVIALFRWLARFRGPSYKDYREDKFFGVVWRWHYSFGEPAGLWCYCPHCDTALVYTDAYQPNRVWFTCELCGQRQHEVTGGDKDYALSRIYRQIDRKLRNKEWLKLVQPDA